ncbi:TPA: helix-turn-helix domain-containing protein [Salmonella enterica subsp. enterica]|nr:helix-turn-helix domain-containing protein [Salmonella enterica]ECC5260885.1 helix-turn-helix domain-containing protein [Salmonella enterica]MIL94127.1 helix-turn-helix domain-containing protein [Salmonella enterica]
MTQYELITLFAKYGYRAFHIKGTDQAFMIALLGYWNHITNECYPSNESIEASCGIRPDNLHRSKKALIAAGLISGKKEDLNKQMGDGKKHSQYVLKIDFIQNKLKAVAESVEQENIIKFKESGADPFAQEESEQIAPWEIEGSILDVQKCTPIEEAVVEAVANNFASLPEEPTTQTCVDEPEQKESNMIELSTGDFARYLEANEVPVMKYFNEFLDNGEVFIPELNATIKKQGAVVMHDYEEDRSPW